jgi:hypothetical protein
MTLACASQVHRTADEPPSAELPAATAERTPPASANPETKSKPAATARADAPMERHKPCAENTPLHDEALAKLEDLEALMTGLAPGDDPRAANEAIASVLRHPCWKVAEHRDFTASSGLALATWWERGADWWLRHHLDLADDSEHRTWVEPPDMPIALTLDLQPEHPLAPILCRLDDASCGRATKGWLRRAETHFGLYARTKYRHSESADDSCDEEAASVEPELRFEEWTACESQKLLRVEALPLGSFEAPSDGWIVLRGRRGHYRFCDEIRAYGLKRGSMYVVKSCSGLALQSGGSVDHRATDAGRTVELEGSRVNLDNLREAALMVLLSPEAQKPGLWHAEGRAIPKEIVVQRSDVITGFGGFSMSSGHTTLEWSWVKHRRVVASGQLQWPDDLNRAASDHAIKLLQIVEASHVPGCAPERLPPLPEVALGGVSGLDADQTSLRVATDILVEGMDDLRKSAKLCR